MAVTDSQIQMEIKGAEKLNPAEWNISGYSISSEKNEGITSIILDEVSKP